jgi:putative transposase
VIVAYIDSFRDRFGVEPICAVLSEHGMKIAPSTYYARKARPVGDAALTEAYLVNALVGLHRANWGCTGCASCGTPPAAPASKSAVTRWGG